MTAIRTLAITTAIAAIAIAGLTTVVVTDRRELTALRSSHATRVQFCTDTYRLYVSTTASFLASSNPLSQSRGDDYYYVLITPMLFDLCHVDEKQLKPELSRVASDCDMIGDPKDYSCIQRIAARVEQLIPTTFDP